MNKIDGKAIADEMLSHLESEVAKCPTVPHLVIVVQGDDPASEIYVRNKVKACSKVGIGASVYRMDASRGPLEMARFIEDLGKDDYVDGIILQRPTLTPNLDDIIAAGIPHTKDVDGVQGRNHKPATVMGVLKLLEKTLYKDGRHDFSGLTACVIGRSKNVGLPVAEVLIDKKATVTVCNSSTPDLSVHTSTADIVVAAAGSPWLVTGDMLKPGAVVIDVGISRDEAGRVLGDCAPDCWERASAMTPVPGGVGPMTVACLVSNTVDAYWMNHATQTYHM